MKVVTLIACHQHAIEVFAGVAKRYCMTTLYDNMKTVVIERDATGEDHAGFLDYARHCGFMIKLCRPYRAKTKGKVERIEHEALKGHKYTFLKNRHNLSNKQEQSLSEIIELYPNRGKAYRLKVRFNDLWERPNKAVATTFLSNKLKRPKFPPSWPSQKQSEGIVVWHYSLRRITHHQQHIGRY